MSETTWAVILWGVALLMLGWTWVPAFISGLGGTRYTNGGSDDPTLLTTAEEPDYVFWKRQLEMHGYGPVGTGWMRFRFYGPSWLSESNVRAFRSAGKGTFAFIQKQASPLDVWWLTVFATCWRDGALLLTNNAVDQPPGTGDYVVQGMETTDLGAVEELHRAEEARQRAAGRRPDPDGSLDTLLGATARHAGPEARYTGVKLGQSYLVAHVAIHTVLSVPAALTMGFLHWSVPMVNLVLGLVLAVSEYEAKRRAGRLMRAQLPRPAGESD
jgi:hypothetical protein